MMIVLFNGNLFGNFDVLVPNPTGYVGGNANPTYLPWI